MKKNTSSVQRVIATTPHMLYVYTYLGIRQEKDINPTNKRSKNVEKVTKLNESRLKKNPDIKTGKTKRNIITQLKCFELSFSHTL